MRVHPIHSAWLTVADITLAGVLIAVAIVAAPFVLIAGAALGVWDWARQQR